MPSAELMKALVQGGATAVLFGLFLWLVLKIALPKAIDAFTSLSEKFVAETNAARNDFRDEMKIQRDETGRQMERLHERVDELRDAIAGCPGRDSLGK